MWISRSPCRSKIYFRFPGGAEESGDGGGDVPEAIGRRAGGGQRGIAAAGDGERRRGAGAGGVQAGKHYTAHEVQGGSVRVDEGRRGAAHAVFHGIPAAVLLSDDGRDGGR